MDKREYDALRVRYEALSRDWNKLRDVERQWRRLERGLFLLGAVFILAALYVAGGG